MYIGTAGGRKAVKNPVVGTASGNRPVNKVWVGTSGGNKLVWQRWTSTTTMTATVASTRQINLSWTASPGASYQLYRNGTAITGVTSSLSYNDTGLNEGTAYSYRVDVIFEGKVQATATATATTGVTPPPQFQQKVVVLNAVEWASYDGSGAKRTDTNNLYFGRYSSSQGLQKSQFRVAVPADLRHCVSVDKVEVSIYGRHTYPNTGTVTSLVVHHNPSLGSVYGGSTATVMDASIGKPGWFGGQEWMTVTGQTSAGRTTVAEEFRVLGAHGFGLMAPGGSTSQTYYGYADGGTSPRVRFTYTVRL